MVNIPEILDNLGYPYKDMGKHYNTKALWRDGNDINSVAIYKDTCMVIDFVTGNKFNLEEFIKLALGNEIDSQKWLKNIGNDVCNLRVEKQQIKIPEIFPPEILLDLIPDYSYWINRNITLQTASLFKGGLCLNSSNILGKLKKRQILTIYDSKNNIVGFSGRDITGNNHIKWKHIGNKNSWVWPAYLNNQYIVKQKELILVESPVDILKMWDCGIQNVICLFGVQCSYAILNYLLKINPRKIYISTNNEPDNDSIGNRAAEKVYSRLKRYFGSNQLEIKLPPKKDFGECSCEEIYKWREFKQIQHS